MPPQTMTRDTVGVISPIVVTTAPRQTAELLKCITGADMEPRLESVDLWTGEHATMNVASMKKTKLPKLFRKSNLSIYICQPNCKNRRTLRTRHSSTNMAKKPPNRPSSIRRIHQRHRYQSKTKRLSSLLRIPRSPSSTIPRR